MINFKCKASWRHFVDREDGGSPIENAEEMPQRRALARGGPSWHLEGRQL